MRPESSASGSISSGCVLSADGRALDGATLHWSDGLITAIQSVADARPSTAHRSGAEETGAAIDASGCWVLPGIVDLHGDAFERCLMPRSGVSVRTRAALADNDTHLLAAGVTTSFLSATDSWEPGLRSRETLRTIVAALASRPAGGPDVRLHVRHERCAVEHLDELGRWITDGTISFLSFNDHTPGGIAHIEGLSASQVARSGVGHDELDRLLRQAVEARPIGLAQEAELAASAHAAGCPLASHDPSTEADFHRDAELGVAVAEFPMTIDLASRYRREGIDVLLGAPNLVRGSSHLGNLSVRDAVAADACSMVCSDYHYPALLHTPFVLGECGLAAMPAAWALVSSAPAAAAGLVDRGALEPGRRADVIVVEPPNGPEDVPVVRAVVGAGRVLLHRP